MKYICILLVAISTAMLSACSTQTTTTSTPILATGVASEAAEPMDHQAQTEHSQVNIDTTSIMGGSNIKPVQSADSNLELTKVAEDDSKGTAKVYLSVKNNQLIAKIITNWNGAVTGDIYLKWIAPKNTVCRSTKVKINKYGENHDYSIAKRSADHLYSNLECKGVWTAEIVTKKGKVLASASADTI